MSEMGDAFSLISHWMAILVKAFYTADALIVSLRPKTPALRSSGGHGAFRRKTLSGLDRLQRIDTRKEYQNQLSLFLLAPYNAVDSVPGRICEVILYDCLCDEGKLRSPVNVKLLLAEHLDS
jgi:hypothetical protein